jgi:co-chaperonin GroES (HSP10)
MKQEIITPLGTKVLITPDKETEKKTAGGLVVVENQDNIQLWRGKVEAVSPDIEDPGIAAEQYVLYEKNSGIEVNDDRGTMRLMEYKSVVAKLD